MLERSSLFIKGSCLCGETEFFNRIMLQFTLLVGQWIFPVKKHSDFGSFASLPDLYLIENLWGWRARGAYKNGKQFETMSALRQSFVHFLAKHSGQPHANACVEYARLIFEVIDKNGNVLTIECNYFIIYYVFYYC